MLAFAWTLSSCASTSSFVESNFDCAERKKAYEYSKKGDVQSAIEWYRKGVAKGDPCSHFMLALKYLSLSEKNSDAESEQYRNEGVALIRKLAEADFSDRNCLRQQMNAQLILSQFYKKGTGVPVDAQLSAYWKQKAEETKKKCN